VPKLLSSGEIVKILLANGFEFISQRGSHQKYRNGSGETVIVPAGRRQIPRGTTHSIIRQSGLDRNLFN
jgi:predicted RNA binding protein YcfA (HicA-like mRNA interferase family)